MLSLPAGTARPRRRVVRVVAAGLAVQLAFGMVFAWGAVVPQVRATEHWPAVLLGAVFSATPAGYGLGTTIGGRLADRLPPRRLCWTALGLLTAGFAVAFAAPSGLTFVVGYGFVALGLGGGLALTGAVGALAQVLPGRAGAAGGLASAAYAGSAVFLAPLLGALAPRLGWIEALRTVGLALAIVSAALVALMPALPPGAPRPRAAVQPGRLLRNRAIQAGFLLALCGATFGAFAAVELTGEVTARHLGAALAAASLGVFAAGNAGGRLAAGLAADRLGPSRVLACVFAVELAAALALFVGVGPVTALAVALAAGSAVGADAGSLSRLGADAAPDRPHSAFGLVFAGFTAGAFLGPIAGALVAPPAGWLAAAVPAGAGLAILARARRAPTPA
ncbi:MAG TPA: MFS transporter [Candidatus Dormibacteraeota bacterium]|nr:MFS transporter [Candidatus Dormibacteraeota bacterium]